MEITLNIEQRSFLIYIHNLAKARKTPFFLSKENLEYINFILNEDVYYDDRNSFHNDGPPAKYYFTDKGQLTVFVRHYKSYKDANKLGYVEKKL